MSQTAITLAFEQWKAQQAATGEPVLLDEFVFALVPGLDPDLPVDRSETLPPAAQIVHRESVTRKGVVNENAVVHSAVLGADVGDFSFNWIGLTNKATGTLAMIVHAPEQQKLKTKEGQQGNVLTRSFLMEFTGAQAETAINTPAETWQIDFTARMAGMDERQRLENIDLYGAGAFFDDGYLVAKSGDQYFVTKGTGYVAGLRSVQAANQNITVTTKPVKVWLDVCWSGALTSVWSVQSKVTVAANLVGYEQNGVKHYVFALASIDANGNITDLRPKGTLDNQQANSSYLVKSKNLSDLTNLVTARKSLELGTAATANRQTSSTDNTGGALMMNGAWGVGGVAPNVDASVGGLYTAGAGNPDNPDGMGYAQLCIAPSGYYSVRLAIQYSVTSPAVYVRTIFGDDKNAWLQLLTTNIADGNYLAKSKNLSDLTNATTARTNLGLKNAATQDVGTGAGTVAAGNDSRIVNALQRESNLSDLSNAGTARNNLGLGSAATRDVGTAGGNVMQVGAWGWGGLAPSSPTDAITSVYFGGVGTAYAPDKNRGFSYLNIGVSGTYRTRLAMDYANQSAPRLFYQNIAGTTYSPWFELYHTGNKPTASDVGAVDGVQLGAEVTVTATTLINGDRTIRAPAGSFISGIVDINSQNPEVKDSDAIITRPLQIRVNGAWRTVSQQ
ncbi:MULTISPECIES: phage tail-collar fiber domain-containing protein [unclassified Pseudocitrobacter]|uniref:phage tail-collar fiber domain-containing protein n=1 Tax=unclassified Pseudocitrobacter TaxID=2638778 RepID=UPI0023E38F65|nr:MULTISPECIES: phage tail protein [unclassified Pseudocitrobacter]MDF3826898.1 phage tail protein [Pseudocitrobacter sp. 2023EL-00150]MEC5375670.1 phage tail protein [Pseudocitrobacter sp. MW920760]